MKKLNKRLLKIAFGIATLLVVLFAFLILFIAKVDISKENCLAVIGEVENIHEGGVYDVVFKLEGDERIFYINRGLENGLELNGLQKELIGKEIKLWHAKSWAMDGGHMTQLEVEDKILYSEWENE